MSTTTISQVPEPERQSADVNDTVVRELDHRMSDGIDVRLLWNPESGCVSIALEDRRLGESLAFDVEAADALTAFRHPYAYAASRG